MNENLSILFLFNIKYKFLYATLNSTVYNPIIISPVIGIFELVVLTFDVLYLVVSLCFLSLITSVYQSAVHGYFLILHLLIPKKKKKNVIVNKV